MARLTTEQKQTKVAQSERFAVILADYKAEYQRCVAAVMAGTMTGDEMKAAIREAGRIQDRAMAEARILRFPSRHARGLA